MPDEQPRYTFDRVVRMTLSAAVLVIVLLLLRYLSDVLIPFAIALVLAYFLNPLVTIFEHRMRRRSHAVAFTLAGLAIVIFALFVLIVPLAYSQFSRFETTLSMLRSDLSSSFDAVAPAPASPAASQPASMESQTALGFSELRSAWDEYRASAGTASRSARLRQLRGSVRGTYVGTVIEGAIAYLKDEHFREEVLPDVLSSAFAGGVTVIGFAVRIVLWFVGLILIFIYLFFLLLDFPEYARDWQMFLPPRYRDAIVDFLKEFDVALRRYFRGQSVIAMITAVLFSIGFTLIGLPLAIPFGIFIGLLNMVPYLQAVAWAPAILLAIVRAVETNGSVLASLGWVALVFVTIQVLQDGFVTPRVMGRATGLRPVAILLGVFIWGRLLGFLGLILAIPLTCLGIAYYRRHVLKHVVQDATTASGQH